MKFTKRVPRWQNPAEKKFTYVGIHLVADFWFGKVIEDSQKIKSILREAAREAHSTPLHFSVHKFSPQGITGLVLLAESHISIHSWPEIQYLAVDIFTCGKKSKPRLALEYLRKVFCPQKVIVKEIKRGSVQ